jgi:hypothetical protein
MSSRGRYEPLWNHLELLLPSLAVSFQGYSPVFKARSLGSSHKFMARVIIIERLLNLKGGHVLLMACASLDKDFAKGYLFKPT